ncbi:MAG TPA: ribonuclease HII [Paracoccaceae bacterium]|nr:ribonuclease HII [Paracoccaceae bacterium]
MPDLSFEAELGHLVAGLDESGRGPWAGPVVAAAVVLDPGAVPEGMDDSKKLPPGRRARLCAEILAVAAVGIGRASVEEIDAMNISQATALAMRRALAALPVTPRHALIDGAWVPSGLGCPASAVVGGDGRCLSVAAASIVAKVTRDRLMTGLARDFPGYGWERNAGYGVLAHAEALKRLGLTPHHRRSFRPIHKMLMEESGIRL